MHPVPVVIVTGASGGIGEATARYFAARGWAVVLAARSVDKLSRIAGEIEAAGGTALVVPVDVVVPEARARLVEHAVSTFGRLDVLVNNAGLGISGTFDTVSLDDLEYVFRVNVLAAVALLQAVVPVMRARGGGVVVNVSSLAEAIPVPYMGGYGASKAALSYVTDAAAVELHRDGIAVVRVTPGLTTTGFDKNLLESGDSLSLQQLLAKADFVTAMPPERVAATIWDAALTRKNRSCLSVLDRLFAFFARHTPRLIHTLLQAAAERYVSPSGAPSDVTVAGDVNRAGVVLGALLAAATIAITAVRLWLRGRSPRQRPPQEAR
jgi:short-subunit dehydrogenase